MHFGHSKETLVSVLCNYLQSGEPERGLSHGFRTVLTAFFP